MYNITRCICVCVHAHALLAIYHNIFSNIITLVLVQRHLNAHENKTYNNRYRSARGAIKFMILQCEKRGVNKYGPLKLKGQFCLTKF